MANPLVRQVSKFLGPFGTPHVDVEAPPGLRIPDGSQTFMPRPKAAAEAVQNPQAYIEALQRPAEQGPFVVPQAIQTEVPLGIRQMEPLPEPAFNPESKIEVKVDDKAIKADHMQRVGDRLNTYVASSDQPGEEFKNYKPVQEKRRAAINKPNYDRMNRMIAVQLDRIKQGKEAGVEPDGMAVQNLLLDIQDAGFLRDALKKRKVKVVDFEGRFLKEAGDLGIKRGPSDFEHESTIAAQARASRERGESIVDRGRLNKLETDWNDNTKALNYQERQKLESLSLSTEAKDQDLLAKRKTVETGTAEMVGNIQRDILPREEDILTLRNYEEELREQGVPVRHAAHDVAEAMKWQRVRSKTRDLYKRYNLENPNLSGQMDKGQAMKDLETIVYDSYQKGEFDLEELSTKNAGIKAFIEEKILDLPPARPERTELGPQGYRVEGTPEHELYQLQEKLLSLGKQERRVQTLDPEVQENYLRMTDQSMQTDARVKELQGQLDEQRSALEAARQARSVRDIRLARDGIQKTEVSLNSAKKEHARVTEAMTRLSADMEKDQSATITRLTDADRDQAKQLIQRIGELEAVGVKAPLPFRKGEVGADGAPETAYETRMELNEDGELVEVAKADDAFGSTEDADRLGAEMRSAEDEMLDELAPWEKDPDVYGETSMMVTEAKERAADHLTTIAEGAAATSRMVQLRNEADAYQWLEQNHPRFAREIEESTWMERSAALPLGNLLRHAESELQYTPDRNASIADINARVLELETQRQEANLRGDTYSPDAEKQQGLWTSELPIVQAAKEQARISAKRFIDLSHKSQDEVFSTYLSKLEGENPAKAEQTILEFGESLGLKRDRQALSDEPGAEMIEESIEEYTGRLQALIHSDPRKFYKSVMRHMHGEKVSAEARARMFEVFGSLPEQQQAKIKKELRTEALPMKTLDGVLTEVEAALPESTRRATMIFKKLKPLMQSIAFTRPEAVEFRADDAKIIKWVGEKAEVMHSLVHGGEYTWGGRKHKVDGLKYYERKVGEGVVPAGKDLAKLRKDEGVDTYLEAYQQRQRELVQHQWNIHNGLTGKGKGISEEDGNGRLKPAFDKQGRRVHSKTTQTQGVSFKDLLNVKVDAGAKVDTFTFRRLYQESMQLGDRPITQDVDRPDVETERGVVLETPSRQEGQAGTVKQFRESYADQRTERQQFLVQWEAQLLGLGSAERLATDNRPSHIVLESIKDIYRRQGELPDNYTGIRDIGPTGMAHTDDQVHLDFEGHRRQHGSEEYWRSDLAIPDYIKIGDKLDDRYGGLRVSREKGQLSDTQRKAMIYAQTELSKAIDVKERDIAIATEKKLEKVLPRLNEELQNLHAQRAEAEAIFLGRKVPKALNEAIELAQAELRDATNRGQGERLPEIRKRLEKLLVRRANAVKTYREKRQKQSRGATRTVEGKEIKGESIYLNPRTETDFEESLIRIKKEGQSESLYVSQVADELYVDKRVSDGGNFRTTEQLKSDIRGFLKRTPDERAQILRKREALESEELKALKKKVMAAAIDARITQEVLDPEQGIQRSQAQKEAENRIAVEAAQDKARQAEVDAQTNLQRSQGQLEEANNQLKQITDEETQINGNLNRLEQQVKGAEDELKELKKAARMAGEPNALADGRADVSAAESQVQIQRTTIDALNQAGAADNPALRPALDNAERELNSAQQRLQEAQTKMEMMENPNLKDGNFFVKKEEAIKQMHAEIEQNRGRVTELNEAKTQSMEGISKAEQDVAFAQDQASKVPPVEEVVERTRQQAGAGDAPPGSPPADDPLGLGGPEGGGTPPGEKKMIQKVLDWLGSQSPEATQIIRKLNLLAPSLNLPPRVNRSLVNAETQGIAIADPLFNKYRELVERMDINETAWAREHFAEYLEKFGADAADRVSADMPAVKGMMKWWQESYTGLKSQAGDSGFAVSELTPSWPRELTPDGAQVLGSDGGALRQSLQAAMDEPIMSYNAFARSDITKAEPFSRFSHDAEAPLTFQHEGKKVAMYETDPFVVIPRAINSWGKKIGMAKEWGHTDFDEVQRLMNENIRQHEPDMQKALDQMQELDGVMKTLRGVPYTGGLAKLAHHFSIFSSPVNGLLLSFAHLPNLIQGGIPATAFGGDKSKIGISYGLKIANKLSKNTHRNEGDPPVTLDDGWTVQETLDFGEKYNVWTKQALLSDIELTGAELGAGAGLSRAAQKANRASRKLTEKIVKGSGLDAINKMVTIHAAVAAKDTFGQAIQNMKAGDSALLDQMSRLFAFNEADINRIMKDGLSDLDAIKVMKTMAGQANLSNPYAVHNRRMHPGLKQMLAFTSIVRSLTSMMYFATRELKQHGNPKPLTRILAMAPIAALGEDQLRDVFYDRDEKEHTLVQISSALTKTGMLGLTGDFKNNALWWYMQSGDRSMRSAFGAAGQAAGNLAMPPALSWSSRFIDKLNRHGAYEAAKTIPAFRVGATGLERAEVVKPEQRPTIGQAIVDVLGEGSSSLL